MTECLTRGMVVLLNVDDQPKPSENIEPNRSAPHPLAGHSLAAIIAAQDLTSGHSSTTNQTPQAFLGGTHSPSGVHAKRDETGTELRNEQRS